MKREELVSQAIASVCEAKRGFLAVEDAPDLIAAIEAAGWAVVSVEDLRQAREAMPRGPGYRGLKHRLDAMIAAARGDA